MSQTEITWSPGYLGKTRWDLQLEALQAAVRHLTTKEVAYALDVGGTHLDDALHGRERKVWHGRWTHVVKAMLLAEQSDRALDLWRAITEADIDGSPWVLVENEELTVEDENKLLRNELARFGDARFGDAGKTAAAKIGKGRKRK